MPGKRCAWAGDDPLYQLYHDREWGVPLHDDRGLFEFLVLEGFQAGLSWITVLKKREAFRAAFDHFDFNKVAEYGDNQVRELLENPGIVRNRLKIHAAIDNAGAFIRIREDYGSFDNYIWGFVGHDPIQNHWRSLKEVPAYTPLAEKISKDMKRRGFSFVGPTIVYSHMQATGMVNDHTTDCFRHGQIKALSNKKNGE